MLRIEPLKDDQAPSAILELVDGPKDIRFAMTARTLARQRGEGQKMNEMTRKNVEKVTKFRADGEAELDKMVEKLNDLEVGERRHAVSAEKRWGGRV